MKPTPNRVMVRIKHLKYIPSIKLHLSINGSSFPFVVADEIIEDKALYYMLNVLREKFKNIDIALPGI